MFVQSSISEIIELENFCKNLTGEKSLSVALKAFVYIYYGLSLKRIEINSKLLIQLMCFNNCERSLYQFLQHVLDNTFELHENKTIIVKGEKERWSVC